MGWVSGCRADDYARPRVIRGTRTAPLPLLPSGPGGVCSRTLHEARDLTSLYRNMAPLGTDPGVPRPAFGRVDTRVCPRVSRPRVSRPRVSRPRVSRWANRVQPANSKGGNWWQSPFCGVSRPTSPSTVKHPPPLGAVWALDRSEEHTSELQSLR